jgi:uncharacterized protein
MKNRVILIHGWGGTPGENWLPWLRNELEKLNITVKAPQLPLSEHPRKDSWLPAISREVGELDENTYFVGHSLAASLIVRYLEQYPKESKCGGIVFVAGFLQSVTNPRNIPELAKITEEWIRPPVDFDRVRARIQESVAIFSTNDYYVPLENMEYFSEKIGSKTILLENMGHFGQKKLPIALTSLKKMMMARS